MRCYHHRSAEAASTADASAPIKKAPQNDTYVGQRWPIPNRQVVFAANSVEAVGWVAQGTANPGRNWATAANTVICATNRPDYIKDSKHFATRSEWKEGALKIGIQTKTPSNAITSQILTFAGWLATVLRYVHGCFHRHLSKNDATKGGSRHSAPNPIHISDNFTVPWNGASNVVVPRGGLACEGLQKCRKTSLSDGTPLRPNMFGPPSYSTQHR